MKLHNANRCQASRAKRGSRGAPPLHKHEYEHKHLYENSTTNMGAERSEAREAPTPLHKHQYKYEDKFDNVLRHRRFDQSTGGFGGGTFPAFWLTQAWNWVKRFSHDPGRAWVTSCIQLPTQAWAWVRCRSQSKCSNPGTDLGARILRVPTQDQSWVARSSAASPGCLDMD